MRRRSEASIQRAVVEYARSKGCICIKQGGGGRFGTAGWPDYLVITPHGHAVFIEFKAPGKGPTYLQQLKIDALRVNMLVAEVVDDVEMGKAIVEEILQ